MAQSPHSRGQKSAPPDTAARLERARGEGRLQQALELARQLSKHEPSEPHLNLLREVSLERGRQLEEQKYVKDAITLYQNALDLGGPPEFRRRLAERLAACGALDKAAVLAQQLGDSKLMSSLQAAGVDRALANVPQGKDALPESLHGEYDAAVQAFAHVAAGRDEEARTTLQTIGLASPFLEWRVLLRGLMAYYAGDDARALENWQRLDAQRLPARLAAPLRYAIDSAYRVAQPPAGQAALQQRYDRLQAAPLASELRRLQKLTVDPEDLPKAFRQAEQLLPELRRTAPDLERRLVDFFRTRIIEDGLPEDLQRFHRVFSAPADDPQLQRLAAQAFEKRGLPAEAHYQWNAYQGWIEKNPSAWPGEQARRARALIYAHMAELAADEEANGGKVNPGAEECWRLSLKLAPEVVSTHFAHFEHLLHDKKPKKAWTAGEKLLERFPDHAPTIETMALLAQKEERLDDSQALYERWLRINPLERRARHGLCHVHEVKARLAAIAKKYDDARAAILAAFALHEAAGKYILFCQAALIELKAKNDEGYRHFLAQAEANRPDPVAISFVLLCEGVRFKVTPAQKKELLAQFTARRAEAVLTPEQWGRAVALASLQRRQPKFSGQATYEKTLLAGIDQPSFDDFSESILEGLSENLIPLARPRVLDTVIRVGKARFPDNPSFWLADAERALTDQRWFGPPPTQSLQRARECIEKLPRGERRDQFQERLERIDAVLRASLESMESIFGRFFGGFGGEEEEP